MADGVSCEGKWFGFTTETWLKHFYISYPGGFSEGSLFSYCELRVAVPRPFGRRNIKSPSQVTPEAHLSSVLVSWGVQSKASLDFCSFL